MAVVPGGPLDLATSRAGVILQAETCCPLMMLAGAIDPKAPSDYAFYIHDRSDTEAGTTQKVRFAAPNWAALPKGDQGPSLGTEDQTVYQEDDVTCKYFCFDGKVDNYTYDQQAVNFSLKDGEIDRLGTQSGYLFERWLCHQLAGNRSDAIIAQASHLPLTGGNAITVQDSSHILIANKSDGTTPANEASLDSTCTATTELIDRALKRASSRKYVTNPIAKCRTPWGMRYVAGFGSDGMQQLRDNDPRNQFLDLQKATLQGGQDYLDSAVANASGFIYGDTVVLHIPALDDPDYPLRGLSGTTEVANTAVGLFFGAGAGQFLFGKGYTGGDHWGYVEMLVKRFLSITVDTVAGFKRTIVGGQSWGAMRLVHYSEG